MKTFRTAYVIFGFLFCMPAIAMLFPFMLFHMKKILVKGMQEKSAEKTYQENMVEIFMPKFIALYNSLYPFAIVISILFWFIVYKWATK